MEQHFNYATGSALDLNLNHRRAAVLSSIPFPSWYTMGRYSFAPDVANYPEKSPYDMDPPLYNLIPEPSDEGQYDTPEIREAAYTVAENTNVNIFARMYGTPPIDIVDEDLEYAGERFPVVSYEEPPPLPHIVLPEATRFLQQINPTGNSPIFLVEVEGETRLLKVVRMLSIALVSLADDLRLPVTRPRRHPRRRRRMGSRSEA